MTKSTVTDWDTTANNNSDIGGNNIAEGCPAAGINDAIRTLMAQVKTWIGDAAGPLLKSGGAMTGAVTGMLTGSTVKDGAGAERYIGYRNIPLTAKSSNYTLALADVGQGVSSTTGGWTIPTNAAVAFAVGDVIVLYNNSGSNQTITQTTGVTLRLAGGSTTGNRTVAQRGLATLIKVGTDEWVASGMGVL